SFNFSGVTIPCIYFSSGSTISLPDIASLPNNIRNPILSLLVRVTSISHVSSASFNSVSITYRDSLEPLVLLTIRLSTTLASQSITYKLFFWIGLILNFTHCSPFFSKGVISSACRADVLAPESTRTFIAGIFNDNKEHHSSPPTIIFCIMIRFDFLLKINKKYIQNETKKNRVSDSFF